MSTLCEAGSTIVGYRWRCATDMSALNSLCVVVMRVT
jgi:hypothetical protein